MTAPTFKLFKAARATKDGYDYHGVVVLPDGRLYTVEAKVVAHHFPPAEAGKHFEGRVFSCHTAGQRMVQNATLTGDREAIPPLVLAQHDTPFDDKLPEDM